MVIHVAPSPRDGGARGPAEILGVLERVLAEQQTLVLRLAALEGQAGDAAARERADLCQHMAYHASAIDRLFAEVGALVPPDGPPLA